MQVKDLGSDSEEAFVGDDDRDSKFSFDESSRAVKTTNGQALTDATIRLNLKVKSLKEELLKMFMEQPKVAKDTFFKNDSRRRG